MAEQGSRDPASKRSAARNTASILFEGAFGPKPDVDTDYGTASKVTDRLRRELEDKGLKGFKKGGNVKKTGVYKLHKGEKVIPANKARSRDGRDVALLKKTRMPR